MTYKILKTNIAIITLFLSCASFAYAGFEITEIMYDLDGTDTNREWVEVKNTGSTPTDLSKWFLFSDNTKHALVPEGEAIVPAGEYAVIAQNAPKFRADWPNYQGMLFDSSWTGFSNDGESIALKDPDLNIVSPVTFTSSQGGAGNGDSLQKIGSSWQGGTPTPGKDNQASTGGGGGGGDTADTQTSTTSEATLKKKENEIPKIITNINTKNTVVAGVPFSVDAVTIGYGGEPLRMGKFVWNFGDGETKEESEHVKFTHTYKYPGEYVIALSYYRVYTATTIDATDRMIVKVIPREVSIASVGNEADPYIELENKANVEVDISGWIIQGATRRFSIPVGTFLLPSKKIKFSGEILGFTGRDMRSVNLYNTMGETVSSYGAYRPESYSYTSSSRSETTKESEVKEETSVIDSPNIINLDNLGASTAGSGANVSNSTLAWLGLAGIITLASVTTILLSKKREENIDGELSADDMKIVE